MLTRAHRLLGLGLGHQTKRIEQRGIQGLRPVKGNLAEPVDGGAVRVGKIAIRAGRNAQPAQEAAPEGTALGFRQRLVALNDGNVGIAFYRGIRYHVVGNATAQGAFLDTRVNG